MRRLRYPDPRGRSAAATAGGRRSAFTLIELLIVMTIIGILLSLILIASRDGIRQSEIRGTQALILKLESGVNDRLDALMQLKPEPNYSHGYLAGTYPDENYKEDDGAPLMMPKAILPSGFPDTKVRTTGRAQAIALADYLKSEMPDVFVIQVGKTDVPSATDYPLNFAAAAFPGVAIGTTPEQQLHSNYVLPLGHSVQGPRVRVTADTWESGYGDGHFEVGSIFKSSNPQLGLTGRGIYGASYSAAAGIYKNLGYLPTGYDMIDNDGNGLIDEWGEGVSSASGGNQEDVLARLRSHTHDTARSEMLYALLVEGQGLLGSAFSADDFSDREVRDTDGDGLPEFVDAWGKPIQFFRWPVFYHSDSQRGQRIGPDPTDPTSPTLFLRPYASVFESREQNPLDPNQTLMAPEWWLGSQNSAYPFRPARGTPSFASGGVVFFEALFHRLTEPMTFTPDSQSDVNYYRYWARDGFSEAGLGYRRAFFTKPLILSGGPDQQPGAKLLDAAAAASMTGADLAAYMLSTENGAVPFDPSEAVVGGQIPEVNFNFMTLPKSIEIFEFGQDDISNHNITAAGGSGG